VIATDFMDDPAAWDAPTSISASLDAARVRADKELSHLTAQRKDTGDPRKPWQTDALFGEIKAAADNFVAKASPKSLHKDVYELLNAPANLTVSVLAGHSTASNVTSSSNVVTGPVPHSTATIKKGP
jgi:hypothetical protein